jgi:hypothetical protein
VDLKTVEMVRATLRDAPEVERARARRCRLSRKERAKRAMERKWDTRRKIQLGGLIVKAGLAEEPRDILLGLLLEAAKALRGPKGPELRDRFARVGTEAFVEGQESEAP